MGVEPSIKLINKIMKIENRGERSNLSLSLSLLEDDLHDQVHPISNFQVEFHSLISLIR